MAASSRPPAILRSLSIRNLRGYAALDIHFASGPQLIWGPNAAGKTTLLEAVVILGQGRSHRTSTDAELIRWGSDFMRVEAVLGRPSATEGRAGAKPVDTDLTVSLQSGGGRKKITVNGVPRRPTALGEHLRTVMFAPEEMLLIVGPPTLRRAALDGLTGPTDPTYSANLATYGRALQQRNSLLRAIREGEGDRDQLRLWDPPFLDAGAAIVAARLRLLARLAEPLAAAHAEIAPSEERLTAAYASNAAAATDEGPREALARRLRETADKELWNGATLIGPHRDDLVFSLGGRDLTTFASRGQQRTAILAFKLAELDLLTAIDGRPPLLLLDDVFSELDPDRRAHLVRRIAELPQALITATDPTEVDPDLRRRSHSWRVTADGEAARLEEVTP
jgi:DNA replication and repair protein RecF